MFCPLTRGHKMLEVAPGLWQCPSCGAGPKPQGQFEFWALSEVEVEGGASHGLAIRWVPSQRRYSASVLTWEVDEDDLVISGTIEETHVQYISCAEEAENWPLPVIVESQSGNDCTLRRMMFPDSLGPKVL